MPAATEAPAIPAFFNEQVQDKLQSARKRRVSCLPIDEFVVKLKEQQDRSKDFLVPLGGLRAGVSESDHVTRDGVVVKHDLTLEMEGMRMSLYESAIGDFVGHAGDMPIPYARRLLRDGTDKQLVELCAHNINEWLQRRAGEKHTRGGSGEKRLFVRTLTQHSGERVVRAVLSDRYYPLSNLQMVSQALGVVSGRVKNEGGDGSAARGARAFDWALDPFGCHIGFVNPTVAFDLKNPKRGIIRGECHSEGSGDHTWVYPNGGGTFNFRDPLSGMPRDQHLVFPACFITNSETGGGSASVELSIMERVCINTARIGQVVSRRHVGGVMERADQYESDATKRKLMEYWLSYMTDCLQQVFDATNFEANCRKFLELGSIEVEDVKAVAVDLMDHIPGHDVLLEEFLLSYQRFYPRKDTLLDVQRALTSIAQDQDNPDRARQLETVAGELVAGKRPAL